MSEGQRKARNIQRWLAGMATVLIVGVGWVPPVTQVIWMNGAIALIAANFVIMALRALGEYR